MTNKVLQDRLDAVERLLAMFQLERMVYLASTSLALVILLVCACTLLFAGGTASVVGGGLLGSSGIIAFTMSRLLHMWDQAIGLISKSERGELDDKP